MPGLPVAVEVFPPEQPVLGRVESEVEEADLRIVQVDISLALIV